MLGNKPHKELKAFILYLENGNLLKRQIGFGFVFLFFSYKVNFQQN